MLLFTLDLEHRPTNLGVSKRFQLHSTVAPQAYYRLARCHPLRQARVQSTLRDPTLAPATRRRAQKHHNGRASYQRWKLGVQWWKTARVQTKGAGQAAWASIRMVAISPGQPMQHELERRRSWVMMDGWRSGGSSMSGSSPNVFHIIRLAFARSPINGTRHVETDKRENQREAKKEKTAHDLHGAGIAGTRRSSGRFPPVRPWQLADQGRQGRQISAGLLDHGLQI